MALTIGPTPDVDSDDDTLSWAGVTRAAGFDDFVTTPTSANLKTLVTDETGSGPLVFATSPSLATPLLGTPTSGNLANCTGFPTGSLSGLGTGVATALAINVGSAGAVVVLNGALGTPSSGSLASCTGLPVSTGISGLGTGIATFLATPSSANLLAAVTDETGSSGAIVFANSPVLVTPTLGVASASTVTVTSNSAPVNGLYLPASNTVGLTSNSIPLFRIAAASNLGRASAFTYLFSPNSGNGVAFRGTGTSGVFGCVDFSNSADTQAGSINIDQAANTTAFNTSSDGRGKPRREPLKNARAVIDKLVIYDFDFAENPIRGVGVVAQEAYRVIPRAITRGDDGPDWSPGSDNFQMWQADNSKFVPYLIAGLQHAHGEMDRMKSRQAFDRIATGAAILAVFLGGCALAALIAYRVPFLE